MEHLREVLRGFGSVVNPLGTRRLYLRSDGGFRRDAMRLNGDWAKVGAGLKKKAEIAQDQYAEPSDYVAGKNA